jgi:ubiquinone biosynthesis protein UbiJ
MDIKEFQQEVSELIQESNQDLVNRMKIRNFHRKIKQLESESLKCQLEIN